MTLDAKQIIALQERGIDWFGKPLVTDGQWGPRTAWWAGVAALGSARESIVRTALGYFAIGVKEDQGRPNRGGSVDDFVRPGKLGVGQPWCAAFSSYVLNEALGSSDDRPYHMSAWALIQWADKCGLTTDSPLPGDRFALLHDPGFNAKTIHNPRNAFTPGHVGFVTGCDANWVSTVEGNIGNAVAVGKRVRSGLVFIRSVTDQLPITMPAGLTNLDSAATR